MLANAKGDTKEFEMPKQAYMKLDEKRPGIALLMLTPWQFKGLGKEKGEEYWILGTQFLQNYYTIYHFGQKKIGLIESVTSTRGQ